MAIKLVQAIESPVEGTPLQWIGIYITQWRPEWNHLPDGFGGEVKIYGFVESEAADELIEAAREVVVDCECPITEEGQHRNRCERLRAAIRKVDDRWLGSS